MLGRQLAFPHSLGGIERSLADVFWVRSGCSAMISSVVMPSATIVTIVAAGMRKSLMQGMPPIISGSVVIRSYSTRRC